MKRSMLVAAVLMAAVGGTAAFGEDVWVKNAQVVVRAGKGPVYDEVATLKKGEKLAVVAREGAWIKVNVNGREGWISEKALSTTQVSGEWKLDIGPTASVKSSAAGRGLQPEAMDYAKGRGVSYVPMENLEKFRDAIRKDPREWEAFMAQGQVGSAAK